MEEYVSFGDVARDRCQVQCQYASRYLLGLNEYPNFGEGLRWTGERWNYHSLRLHRDDVEIFVSRLNKHLDRWESNG